MVLKPRKTAFMFVAMYRLIILSLVLLIISLFFPVVILPIIGVLLLINGISYLIIQTSYKKESYTFYADKIVRTSGGIFSDQKIDLPVSKIVYLKLKKPFLLSKLFKVENLYIESAGSSKSEIILLAIPEEKKFLLTVKGLMQKNGINMQGDKLLYEERPSNLGIFLEIGKSMVAGIFTVLVLFSVVIPNALNDVQDEISGYSVLIMNVVLTLILLVVLAKTILSFLDLKLRVYKIYDNCITYADGFLTKNYTIIPNQKLADSDITQTFWEKLFGLYDVKISCKGAGKEILFKNIKKGPEISKTIKGLINHKEVKETPIEKPADLDSRQRVAEVLTPKESFSTRSEAPEVTSNVVLNKSFTCVLKADTIRTILPYLITLPLLLIGMFFAPILGIALIASVGNIIKTLVTKFKINENSVETEYDFFTSNHTEFTNDRITKVHFGQGLVDKFFNTTQVSFSSIGSGSKVYFKNIKLTDEIKNNILQKFGIKDGRKIKTIKSEFSFLAFVKANFVWWFLLFFLAVALAVIASQDLWILGMFFVFGVVCLLLVMLYKSYYYKKSQVTFFHNYIKQIKGWIITEEIFTFYKDIKDNKIVRYPFADVGTLSLNIAGESLVTQKNHKSGRMSVMGNEIVIHYVENIGEYLFKLDPFLQKQGNLKSEAEAAQFLSKIQPELVIIKDKPALGNFFVPLFILFALAALTFMGIAVPQGALVLALIFVTILGVSTLYIKSQTIIIEKDRVLKKSGILFKKQVSIPFKKIDHSIVSAGFLNKIFMNGNVEVYTIGSNTAELTFKNIRLFNKIGDFINQKH